MNFIIWVFAGAAVGLGASLIAGTRKIQALIIVTAGVIGAVTGGLWLAPTLGLGMLTQDDFSIGALLASNLGGLAFTAVAVAVVLWLRQTSYPSASVRMPNEIDPLPGVPPKPPRSSRR